VRIVEGTGRVRIEFAPRLDFGRVHTHLTGRDGGLVVEDTLDPIVLRSPGVKWSIETEGNHKIACAEVELNGDAPLLLELRYGTGSLRELSRSPQDRMRITERFWSSWAEQLTLPGMASDFARRGALALKALCYGPTGAISAAATTSLPETLGGVRNWDYRYCWLRDTTFTLQALMNSGYYEEAKAWRDWLLRALAGAPDQVQIMYGIAGERRLNAACPNAGTLPETPGMNA